MGLFKSLKEKVFGKKIEQKEKYDSGLSKSRKSLKDKLNSVLARYRKVDESYFIELEELLIEADVGATLAMEIVDATKYQARLDKIDDPLKINEIMFEKMLTMYNFEEYENKLHFAEEGLSVFLFEGVNGVGKTTSMAKLTYYLQQQGKKVLWAAGDTFRAGAVEQLEIWANRIGVNVIKGKLNADPASVIFDAVKQAKEGNYDVLICDTAGRLQTKVNLMNEIGKIKRVIQKEIPDGPHETFLVLDATTGQNGIYQANSFVEATGVSGIILTKMDGTSKGGIVLAIKDKLNIPVKFIGLGEKMEDLMEFDLEQYLYSLIGLGGEE